MRFFQVIAWWFVVGQRSCQATNRWKFRTDLFKDYDAQVPPNENKEEPLNVLVSLSLNKMGVDILGGNLHLDGWLRMKWYDDRLEYNGSEVFGARFDPANPRASSLPVPTVVGDDQTLWVPDVQCESSADFFGGFHDTNAQLFPSNISGSAGNKWNLLLSRPGAFNVYCKANLAKFPFDVQFCSLRFTSWAFDASQLKIIADVEGWQDLKKAGASSTTAGEYELVDIRQFISEDTYVSGDFSVLTVELTLNRLPVYYVHNAILPMFMMVVLGALSFWIPFKSAYGGSGERLAYASTSLLTIVAVLLFTAEGKPMISQTTWLDHWQNTCIFFTLVPIIETVMVFWVDSILEKVKERVIESEENAAEMDMIKPQPPVVDQTSTPDIMSGPEGDTSQVRHRSDSDTSQEGRTSHRSPNAIIMKREASIQNKRLKDADRIAMWILFTFGDSVSVDIFFRRFYPIVSVTTLMIMYLKAGGDFVHLADSALFWLVFVLALVLVVYSIVRIILVFVSYKEASRFDMHIISRITQLNSHPLSANHNPSARARWQRAHALATAATTFTSHQTDPKAEEGTGIEKTKALDLVWQVELDDGWRNLEAEQQKKLNEALADERDKLCFTNRGFYYEVRFESHKSATQFNLQTGTQRKLRARIAGSGRVVT